MSGEHGKKSLSIIDEEKNNNIKTKKLLSMFFFLVFFVSKTKREKGHLIEGRGSIAS